MSILEAFRSFLVESFEIVTVPVTKDFLEALSVALPESSFETFQLLYFMVIRSTI